MKTYCRFCGCHFPDDFDKTLEAPCNFWGDHGLSNISTEIKKEIWDWLFSAPIDKLNILYNIDMPISFESKPLMSGGAFEDIVSNWSDLTEEEKQNFQRNWFKNRMSGKPLPALPITYLK